MDAMDIDRASIKKRRERDIDRAAKAIFWRMNAVMHDHDAEWRKCLNKIVYRDCAAAALAAVRD